MDNLDNIKEEQRKKVVKVSSTSKFLSGHPSLITLGLLFLLQNLDKLVNLRTLSLQVCMAGVAEAF